ncbi:MAG TPA: sulfopyruvate decarboxylase subunit beta [Methanotrichaceae archaeon]|nr:sulfopyruvate decarboxylase subunit beta [Methanotrichaceae archaeon]
MMKRIEAISAVASAAGDALIVCNLGFPCRELYSINDRPENFYMLGSMGLASSIGLGLALARPGRKVISLDGDGAVLMNLGTLATIAGFAPDNYLLVMLDNGAYCSTGCQPTATSRSTDLAEMARGAGIRDVREVSTPEDLAAAISGMVGCAVVAKVDAGNADVPVIDLSPEQIRDRFMKSAAAPGLDSAGIMSLK